MLYAVSIEFLFIRRGGGGGGENLLCHLSIDGEKTEYTVICV